MTFNGALHVSRLTQRQSILFCRRKNLLPACVSCCSWLSSRASTRPVSCSPILSTPAAATNIGVGGRCSYSIYSKDAYEYERLSEETLESLSEKFEEVLENQTQIEDTDVSLSSGVLTVNLGSYGIYVINKQTPNRQLWLSSPISGPKRYDFKDGEWVYKYETLTLHQLLTKEISTILETDADFTVCDYGRKNENG